MRTPRAICETIHLGALGLWAGAVVMTGVTAAIAFPTMKALDPTLPDFAAYSGPHWMIAAGKVMNKAFFVADWIGVACAIIAALTLLFVIFVARVRFTRLATVLRTAALVGAIGVTVHAIGVLRPRMESELSAYWNAAQAGQNDEALEHREAFERMHPTASFMLVAQLVLILWAIGAGGYAAFSEPTRPTAEEQTG